MLNMTGLPAAGRRNLIVELRHWKFAPGGGPGGEQPQIWVYKTNYWYDEVGNRICKKTAIWQPSGQIEPGIESIEQIVEEGDNPTGTWNLLETIFYVRDVTGKEIAIYSGNNIEQWNMYGLDNVGAIKSNGDKQFYLKDHLGSIRAILDSTNTVVVANDYDAWGYPLEYRNYEPVNQRYKFTGKERDRESSLDGNGYDYFGARYYDSRIGRWGGVEQLLDRYDSWSPYCYSLLNPILISDINGLDVYIHGEDAVATVKALNESTTINLFLAIDPSSGKLEAEGRAGNVAEQKLLEAINSKDVLVNIKTIESNTYKSIDGSTQLIMTGAFDGSYINSEGKVVTSQFLNISQAQKLENIGGPTVGQTALHEINESYIGGSSPKYKGKLYDSEIFNKVHRMTKKLDPPSGKFKVIKEKGSKYTYLGYKGPKGSTYLYKIERGSGQISEP